MTGLSKFSLAALHEAEVYPMNFVPSGSPGSATPEAPGLNLHIGFRITYGEE